MSFKSHKTILLASIVGLLLAACGAAPAQSWAGVTVSNETETIYIANDTRLYALSTDGQTLRWQQPASSGSDGFFGLFGGGSNPNNTSVNLAPVFADPVVAGDLLIVSSYNKSVYGLNIKDGTQKWVFSQSADRLIAPPVVQGQVVYVASADNSLYALDLADGSLKWTFKTEASLWGAPVPTAEVIYVPSMDRNLYALDGDGSLIWKATLNGSLAGSPTLSEDGKTIYVGTLNDTLYALNTQGGGERWSVSTQGWVWTTPVVADGVVYFADLEGSVFAHDAATGAEKWTTGIGGAVRGTPVIAGESLIVAVEEGLVYALNLTDGSKKWEHTIDGQNADRLLSNLLVIGDKVLIVPLAAEKLVYALKVSDGNEAWTYKP